jgi:hypothetical protein
MPPCCHAAVPPCCSLLGCLPCGCAAERHCCCATVLLSCRAATLRRGRAAGRLHERTFPPMPGRTGTHVRLPRCRAATLPRCHAAVLLPYCPAAVSLLLLCRGVDVQMHGSAAGRLFGSAAGLPCCCAVVPPSWSPLCRRAASSLSYGAVEMPGGQAAAWVCCGAVRRRSSVPPCLCATALLYRGSWAAVPLRCRATALPCCRAVDRPSRCVAALLRC